MTDRNPYKSPDSKVVEFVSQKLRISDIAFYGLCLGTATLSLAFMHTDGLRVLPGNQGPTYTREFASSGSNDDLCIGVGAFLFGAALVVKLIRLRKPVNGLNDFILGLAFLLQIFYLLLIEAGSIAHTIQADGNVVLIFWLCFLALIPLYLVAKYTHLALKDAPVL